MPSPQFLWQKAYIQSIPDITEVRRMRHLGSVHRWTKCLTSMSYLLCYQMWKVNTAALIMNSHSKICPINHFVILKWQQFHFGSKLFSHCLTQGCYPPYTVAEARGSQGKEVHYTSGSISACVRTIPLSMKDDSICPLSHFACPNAPAGPSLPAHRPLWFVGIRSQER